MRRKSINCVWTDDIIRPDIASFLHFPEIILLVIIEIESLVIVSRELFFKRDPSRSQMHTVILQHNQLNSYQPGRYQTYLPASLKRNTLKFRTSHINRIHKVPEQGNILLLQDPEVIIVHIRGEVSMGHIRAEILYLPNDFINGVEEVHGDEFNPGIGPVIGEWPSGGDNDFAPALYSLN